MKRIIIISIFFVLFSFVKTESLLADRLLLGVDFIGFGYENKVDSVSNESGVQWITQCKPDQEKTPKTGDYVTDECGETIGVDVGAATSALWLQVHFNAISTAATKGTIVFQAANITGTAAGTHLLAGSHVVYKKW